MGRYTLFADDGQLGELDHQHPPDIVHEKHMHARRFPDPSTATTAPSPNLSWRTRWPFTKPTSASWLIVLVVRGRGGAEIVAAAPAAGAETAALVSAIPPPDARRLPRRCRSRRRAARIRTSAAAGSVAAPPARCGLGRRTGRRDLQMYCLSISRKNREPTDSWYMP